MSADSLDRRLHPRVTGPFDGRRVDMLSMAVQIYDLSEGGCFVNSIHDQQSDVPIVLEIDLSDGPITLQGRTLYSKPEFGFAVRFTDMTDALSMRIRRALQQITG